MAAHDRSASRPSRPEGGDGDNPDANEAEFLGFSYAWPNRRLPLVLDRATPKGRAGCLKRARPDLCGGRRVTGVPTANVRTARPCDADRVMRGHGETACAIRPDPPPGKMWAAAHNFRAAFDKGGIRPRIAVRAIRVPAIQTAVCRRTNSRAAAVQGCWLGATPAPSTGRGAAGCVFPLDARGPVHRRSRRRRPDRPRDEVVQLRGHRAAGVSAARPLERVGRRARRAVDAPRCSTGARVRRRSSCSVRFAVVTGVLLDAVRLPRVLTEVCAAKVTRRAPSGRIRRGKMWAAARNFSCGVRKGGVPPRIAVGAIPEPANPNRGCRCASSRAAAVQAVRKKLRAALLVQAAFTSTSTPRFRRRRRRLWVTRCLSRSGRYRPPRSW